MPIPPSYEKPVPREEHASPSWRTRIQVQNRRREYLHRHPTYFENLDHELAGQTPPTPPHLSSLHNLGVVSLTLKGGIYLQTTHRSYPI